MKKENKVQAVVLLDEIGLAENASHQPLKVLHKLLEPDDCDRPNVAVIGLSNWEMDPAKMNRVLHISCPVMTLEEMKQTISVVYQSVTYKEEVNKVEKDFLDKLSNAFYDYDKEQSEGFQTVRDLYMLVKHIGKQVKANGKCERIDLEKYLLKGIHRNLNWIDTNNSLISKMKLKFSQNSGANLQELIKSNLEDPYCRHLMLFCKGDSVIEVLISIIKSLKRIYVPIFGSQFDDDQNEDYGYEILSKITQCMEQGDILILKDLHLVYGSLYDMLNQNYTTIMKRKLCRVALGAYSSMCTVHDLFKCIVVTDESIVTSENIPFLSRFEKLSFSMRQMLEDQSLEFTKKLQNILAQACDNTRGKNALIIPNYDEDLIFSLISYLKGSEIEISAMTCFDQLIRIMLPEAIVKLQFSNLREKDSSFVDVDQIIEKYLSLPLHRGFHAFLCMICGNDDDDNDAFHVNRCKDVDDDGRGSDFLVHEEDTEKSCPPSENITANSAVERKEEACLLSENMKKIGSSVLERKEGIRPLSVIQTNTDSLTSEGTKTEASSNFERKGEVYCSSKSIRRKETSDLNRKEKVCHSSESITETASSTLETRCKLCAVFTFSNIHDRLLGSSKDPNIYLIKLNEITSEHNLRECLNRFWESTTKKILIIQCSEKHDFQHTFFTRHIIDKMRNEYLLNKTDVAKHVFFILHVYKNSTTTKSLFSTFHFNCGWSIFTMDTVKRPLLPLPDIFGKSLPEVLESINYKEVMKKQLFWVFTRLSYRLRTRDSLFEIIDQLKKEEDIFSAILDKAKTYVVKNVETTVGENWLFQVATSNYALSSSSTFSDALENFIIGLIRDPFACLVYILEDSFALHTVLRSGIRQSIVITWIELLKDEDVVFITDVIQNPGPSSYPVEGSTVKLTMPFSKLFIAKIEKIREIFVREKEIIKRKYNLELDEDFIDLREDIKKPLVHSLQGKIQTVIKPLEGKFYPGIALDYLKDFSQYFSKLESSSDAKDTHYCFCWTLRKLLNREEQTFFSKLIASRHEVKSIEELAKFVTLLHLKQWLFSAQITSVLNLLRYGKENKSSEVQYTLEKLDNEISCQQDRTAIQTESKNFAEISYVKAFPLLVDHICLAMIEPKVFQSKKCQLTQWRTKANTMATLASCIAPGISSVILLRFFIDISCVKLRPSSENHLVELATFWAKARCDIVDIEMLDRIIKVTERNKSMQGQILFKYAHRCYQFDPENIDIFLKITEQLSQCSQNLEEIQFVQTLSFFLRDAFQECSLRYPDLTALTDKGIWKLLARHVQCRKLNWLIGDIFEKEWCNVDLMLEKFRNKDLQETLIEKLKRSCHVLQKSCRPTLEYVDSVSFVRTVISFLLRLTNNVQFKTLNGIEINFIKNLNRLIVGSRHWKDITYTLIQKYKRKFGSLHLQRWMRTLQVFEIFCEQETRHENACFEEKSLSLLVNAQQYTALSKCVSTQSITEESIRTICIDPQRDSLPLLASYLYENVFIAQFHRNIDDKIAQQILSVAFKCNRNPNTSQKMILTCFATSDSFQLDKLRVSPQADYCQLQFVVFITSVMYVAFCKLSEHNIFVELMNGKYADILETSAFTSKRYQKEHRMLSLCKNCRNRVPDNGRCTCPLCSHDLKKSDTKSLSNISFFPSSGKTYDPVTIDLLRLLRLGTATSAVALKCDAKAIGSWFNKCDDLGHSLSADVYSSFEKITHTLHVSRHELGRLVIIILKTVLERYEKETESPENITFDDVHETVHEILKKRYQKLIAQAEILNEDMKSAENCLHHYEETGLSDTSMISRRDLVPSMDNLQAELFLQELDGKFPLLTIILMWRKHISVLEYFIPMVEWHRNLAVCHRYEFRKTDCRKMSVETFLKSVSGDESIKMHKRWNKFKKAWDKVQSKENMTVLESFVSTLPTTVSASEEEKIANFIIFDENSPLYLILRAMANIHNSVLDDVICLASSTVDCLPLSVTYRKDLIPSFPLCSLVECKDSDILSAITDEYAERFMQRNVNQKDPTTFIKYNFEKIEAELALDVLVDRKYLEIDTPGFWIEFKDDLFQRSVELLRSLSAVCPQTPNLPRNISRTLIEENDLDTNKDLLDILGILAVMLLETGGNSKDKIMTYYDNLPEHFTKTSRDIIPSTANLEHITCIYQTIEELHGQCLLEGMGDDFPMQELEMEAEIKIDTSTKEDWKDIWLGIKLFTHRSFATIEEKENHYEALRIYMQEDSFWPIDYVDVYKKMRLKRLMPLDIKVKHLHQLHLFLKDRLIQKVFDTSTSVQRQMSSLSTPGQMNKKMNKTKKAGRS